MKTPATNLGEDIVEDHGGHLEPVRGFGSELGESGRLLLLRQSFHSPVRGFQPGGQSRQIGGIRIVFLIPCFKIRQPGVAREIIVFPDNTGGGVVPDFPGFRALGKPEDILGPLVILAFSLTTPAVYLGDHRDVISLDCEVKMGYNKDRLPNL